MRIYAAMVPLFNFVMMCRNGPHFCYLWLMGDNNGHYCTCTKRACSRFVRGRYSCKIYTKYAEDSEVKQMVKNKFGSRLWLLFSTVTYL